MHRKQNSSYGGVGAKWVKQINCTMMDKNTIFGDAEYTDAEI